MELPRDILFGEMILRLSGNREVLIENYKGIYEYTKERIIILGKKQNLKIEGCQLHISYFSGYDMKVVGAIDSLTYLSNGELCC